MIHHFDLSRAAAEDVFRTLATETLADRLHNPGLEPARADVIVGGCCVLVPLLRTLGRDGMLVSESDILDGLVLEPRRAETSHDGPRPDRLLMGPGPCNPYPEAVAALGRPMLGHLDPEFIALLDEMCARLRTVFRTPTRSRSRSAAPARPAWRRRSSTWSARATSWSSASTACSASAWARSRPAAAPRSCAVEHEWGHAGRPERVLAAHPAPKVIAVVHAETSTGVRSDVAALGAGKGDALLLVDCVTSLGGIEVDIDGWGVDLAYSGTQKCLGVPPGLAPLTVGERARERLVERSQSWYLDLQLHRRYTGPATGRRTYHHTAPVSMVQSLHGGLGDAARRGPRRGAGRATRRAARSLQDGLEAMGLELFAEEGHRLPQLTTVRVPDGVDDAAVRTAAARPLRHRDRRRRRRVRRQGVAHRLHGPHRAPGERRRASSARSASSSSADRRRGT